MKATFSENFHLALLSHYKEMVIEAVRESDSDHHTTLDIGLLNQKLKVIYQGAKMDGVSIEELDRIINEVQSRSSYKHAA